MPTKNMAAKILRETLGKPGKEDTENRAMLDAICRATLRYPSPESLQVIKDLKDAITLFVNQHNDDALLEVLIKTANEGAGITTAAALRTWCDMPNDNPSRDVAIISSLLSAFSYTSLREAPAKDTPTMAAVRPIMAGAPPYIGAAFDTRGDEMGPGRVIRGSSRDRKEPERGFFIAPNRSPSVASGINNENGFTSTAPSSPKRQAFIYNSAFAKACQEAGVPLVGHVSGTTPNNLGAANGLLRDLRISRGENGVGLDYESARLWAGLTAARFHRDAFHSTAEVLVGLRHWAAHQHKGPNGFAPQHPEQSMELYQTPENVRDLFIESVQLMKEASAPIVQQCVVLLEDDLRAVPMLSDMATIPMSSPLYVGLKEEEMVENFEDDLSLDELDAARGLDGVEEAAAQELIHRYVKPEAMAPEEQAECVTTKIKDALLQSKARDWAEENELDNELSSRSPGASS